MNRLEREIKAKLELAHSALMASPPAKDYAEYLRLHARYTVLQELDDFIRERNERLATGDEKPDDD